MVRKNKTKILLALLLCGHLMVQAQDRYQWQSRLSATSGEGFYRVLISPSITARSDDSQRDLRVVDSAGHYVPYLIKSEAPQTQVQDFQPLQFTTKTDSVFSVQIENPTARQYASLWLTMRNKTLSNAAFLSGSDDGQKWFDISGDIILSPSREMAADTFEQQISFPPVKYRHLKLSMHMSGAIPVNIVRIGIYESLSTGGRYSVIPAPQLTQRDSGKISYLSLRYDGAYRIDRLMLSIEGPKLYHRHVTIYSCDTSGKTLVGEYMLSSAANNEIELSVKTTDLLLEIDNEDNPPLNVRSAASMQLNRYALMYLDGDRSYYLLFGNAKAEVPVYDLKYFEDSLLAHPPKELTAGAITANAIIPTTEPAHIETKGLKKYWIWPVLIVVLGILLFFTLKMGKEMSAEKK